MSKIPGLADAADKIRRELEAEDEVRVTIALFGQPGAGKSSLINRLIGEPLAPVGVATDKTRSATAYEYNGVHLVDLPGFDTARFPRETFWETFEIEGFDLFLCVFSDKLGRAEVEFFSELHHKGRTCLFVRNKSDHIWDEVKPRAELVAEIQKDVAHLVRAEVTVHFTSCRDGSGLDRLSEAVAAHLDGAKADRWFESAKAHSLDFLEKKRKVAKRKVRLTAGLAAANAVNPVPGAGVAVDVSMLMALFRSIRKTYGLTDKRIVKVKELGVPALAHVASEVAQYSTREGVFALLKRYAGQEAAKSVTRYVPFVGQAVAASVGFGITLRAGKSYLNDCHTMAQAILERELAQQND